jgi:hypothetical protein
MAKFIVTVQRTYTTEIVVDADTAVAARKQIEEYGVVEAASDMASDDTCAAKIKSVHAVESRVPLKGVGGGDSM